MAIPAIENYFKLYPEELDEYKQAYKRVLAMCAARYGSMAAGSLDLGNYYSARQYAIEAWHYASLATASRES